MSGVSPRRTLSWRAKLVLLMLCFGTVPPIGIALLALDSFERALHDSTLDGLQAVARAKADAIGQFTDIRRRDVEQLSKLLAPAVDSLRTAEARAEATRPAAVPEAQELPALRDAEKLEQPAPPEPGVTAPPPSPDTRKPDEVARAAAELHRTLGLLLWDQSDFEELLVIAPDGRVVAATFSGHSGKSAAELAYFQAGSKASYVQPVFRSPITEQLTMVISTPIRNHQETTIGVLAARLNLKRFFLLIGETTGLGASGETVVAKQLGDVLTFMAPTRHHPKAALEPVGGTDGSASALSQAARASSGRGLERDYRGRDVLAAWTFIPALEWGLVVKIDHDEALAPLVAARTHTAAAALVVALLVIAASFAVSRALVRPLRDLKYATDRISRGDLAVQLDIRSNDEIGELADSFERMIAAIRFFRERSRAAPDEDLDESSDEESQDEPPAR